MSMSAELASYLGVTTAAERNFVFDRVFGPEVSQAKVFEELAKNTVDDVLQGCVCLYGWCAAVSV